MAVVTPVMTFPNSIPPRYILSSNIMRECVRNADCDSGNCSSSRCWELNGPFVPCNPSHKKACAKNLKCDPDSHYCVPKSWSSSAECERHAHCGKDSWCNSSRKQCIKYQLIGEACNTTNLKCGNDAACFGGYCRAKCDVSQGEETGCSWVYEDDAHYDGNIADLRCRKVQKYGEFEVCLPKGLALVHGNEPTSSGNPEPKTDDTVGDKRVELEASNGKYWLIAGAALVVFTGLAALLLFVRAKRVASRKGQKQQKDSTRRPSPLSLHNPHVAPIIVASEKGKTTDAGLDRA